MNFKYVLATFIGSLVLSVGNAQITINVAVNGPTSAPVCDGSIYVDVDGVGNITGVSEIFGWPNDYEVYPEQLSIDSICILEPPPTHTSGKIENDSCLTIGIGVLLGSLSPAMFANDSSSFSIMVQLPTDEYAQDGSIQVTGIDLGSYDVDFYTGTILSNVNSLSNNENYPGTDSIGTGLTINGLGPDLYLVRVENNVLAYGRASSIAIGLEPWSTMGCQDSIGVIPTVTGVSNPNVCDGAVSCEGWGSVPPYEFYHTNLGVWGADQTGLCEGLHVVEIIDQINNSAFQSYIIPAPENTFNSFDWPFTPGIDTLFASATENCDLDFNQPIDSFYIDQVLFLDSSAIQSIWHFYQNGEVFTITQEFAIDGLNPSILALGIYCENGRSAALGYYYVYDEFDMTEVGYVGLGEEARDDILISPNPSSGIFEVSGLEPDSRVDVIDVSGRRVTIEHTDQGTKTKIDLGMHQTGIYLIRVVGSNGTTTKRIIKN